MSSIRRFDGGIFDIENLDKIVKYAGWEAKAIVRLSWKFKSVQIDEDVVVTKTPFKLLQDAGYYSYLAGTLKKTK